MTGALVTIEEAIARLKAGKMIALLDDEHRENEGDLVIAADYATPEAINFMARFGRGLICLSMAEQLIDKLNLPMMTSNNKSPFGTAFTVSIEAASGVSTGISAKDRAHTIAVAIHPDTKAQDVITPGHIFPLKACTNGVLERTGQTEGSVDLMKLAGLTPAAVICEI
ncbi:MAG TPA: 3,4-dihydroxy-2-butanone-4-phosphate synthase, partial [Legionellales bacterium]|nr:3,4-dihydroxy-2-butanone-4-phosphate synthase [Legionellales bacterium]